MDVSILIPTFNESAHLKPAVEAMLRQRFDGEIEVLIIDGHSDDGTRLVIEDLMRADARIGVFDNDARQTASGLNIGLKQARGRYVARMDAHTYYPPGYLAIGVDRLRRGDVEHVSGPQVAYGEGTWSRRIALALSTRLGVGGATYRNATKEIDVDTGFTGVWRRETLLAHGGWDEEWPVNQDGELAARIRRGGGRIVCLPGMAARYVPRDSLKALTRQYWRYGQYRVKTSRRHPASMRRSHVLPPALCLATILALLPNPRLSRLPRVVLALYVLTLVSAAVRAGAAGRAKPLDAAALPLVLGTMHLSWGFGFLAGCIRFGFPSSAVAHVGLLQRPQFATESALRQSR